MFPTLRICLGTTVFSSQSDSLSDVKGPVHCTMMFVGFHDGLCKDQPVMFCRGYLLCHKLPETEILNVAGGTCTAVK